MALYLGLLIVLVGFFKSVLAALPFGAAVMLVGILFILAALIRMTIKQGVLLLLMIALAVGLRFYVQWRLVPPQQKTGTQVQSVFQQPQQPLPLTAPEQETAPEQPAPENELPQETGVQQPVNTPQEGVVTPAPEDNPLSQTTETVPPAANDYTPQMPTALPAKKRLMPGSQTDAQLLAGAKSGEIETVKAALAMGADPNVGEVKWHETPLHWAAMGGHTEIVKLLLASGAKVRAKEAGGRTPLHWSSKVEITQLLLAAGADVNARDNVGYTPLIEAATGGRADIAKALLKAGAEVDAYGKDKRTALGWAAMYGQPEVARVLLDANASVDIPDEAGKTPWMWASVNHHNDILRLMSAAKQRKDNQKALKKAGLL